ncbi:hypothetical protein O181_111406 [Austropuccinia psidii MF-1]|uniref:GAG-pre-integrase domain-containing protein n=1 Tax=Austropuccinia psidii MF-1 TaxID=1389203 RepID=A0A9Q3K109_9BASI|nr:hypothetical protein [Austropuccinia psidii MF-1]
MPKIPLDIHDSSLDKEVIKARITKLTRTNWVQWSCQFENYLISKGMDDLLDPPSEDVKKTTKFKKRNGGALSLLWSSVSTEFEGVLLNNKTSFYNCWVGLGNCCGKNSVVVICRTLHKLVNLRYAPGSSLEKHVDEFQKIHASYLSISADSSIRMTLLSSMAAAFFLQSLDNKKELSSLCQTLYDIKPFNLNTITDRAESSKSKEKNQAEGGRKKKGPKDKKKGKNNTQGKVRNTNQEQDKNKQIDRIEQLLEKLQSANLTSLNAASDSRELNHPPESDSEAFIFDEVNAMIGKSHQRLIYLNSGAGRTVVNDLTLLDNPTPVLKHINTFLNPVKVTHQGTLVFKGVKLYPVYYAPDGPVNLLSVPQLVDHGMKLVSKSNMFLTKYENQIVDTFHQQGNLFASRLPMTSNWVYSLPTFNLDWHLVLGHPSDSYITFLLKEHKIKGKFTLSSDCPVCQQAKIKNRPHSQTLPCADAPFSKIHMDTLQIKPPTRKGHKYVLVLIDD